MYRGRGYISIPSKHPDPMPTIALSIQGMSCGHCVHAVKRALESVPGVSVTDVHVGAASVVTELNPVPVDAIKAAIEDAGYFAEVAPG